jgi:hypothetical protein
MTCGQRFTGSMELGLAEAWWSSAQRLPEENEQRWAAAENLAIALRTQDMKHAEAERMHHRKVLAVQQRELGPEHPDTLSTAFNLAVTLTSQGQVCTSREGVPRCACSSGARSGTRTPRYADDDQ